MSFSSMLSKFVNGETLTELEKQEIVLEARRLEEVSSLVTSLIQPGTRLLKIEGLTAENADIINATFENVEIANSDVTFNEYGIFIKNQEGLIGFENLAGDNPEVAGLYIDGFDQLVIYNLEPVGTRLDIETTAGQAVAVYVKEDAAVAERLQLHVEEGTQGAKISMGNTGLELQTEGSAGGTNHLTLPHSTNTPSSPSENTTARIYVRNSKLIIQWNESGTTRYKYLDLVGTGVTWTHTTSAP